MTDLTNLIGHVISEVPSNRIKILDLGSGWINSKIELLLLKYRNVFNYTAVDINTPYSIFSREPNDDIQSFQEVTIADWVQKINHSLSYNEENQYEEINETEFNEMFRLEFGKDAFEYCRENVSKEKNDIIVISNLLHFLDRQIADELVSLCISMLNEGGIIYISVFNDEQTQYQRKNPYSRKDFETLKKGLQIIEENNQASLHHELLGRKIAAYNSG
ncbi:MAG: hypothetical protein KA408_02190 [Flavobacteriales bacterium]|nr:hypothetical protein [Flavobacteriales bacterium]